MGGIRKSTSLFRERERERGDKLSLERKLRGQVRSKSSSCIKWIKYKHTNTHNSFKTEKIKNWRRLKENIKEVMRIKEKFKLKI